MLIKKSQRQIIKKVKVHRLHKKPTGNVWAPNG